MEKYEQLKVAVQDLLAELRIDETCLELMAKGYSPDYPGVESSLECNPHCKIQLSQIVARKLLDAGIQE